MKEILSYWDILLGLLSISLGICRLIKFQKLKNIDDNKMLRTGKWIVSYSRYIDNKFYYSMYMFLILIGILFIYNRLKGNMPNIFILIKYIFTN